MKRLSFSLIGLVLMASQSFAAGDAPEPAALKADMDLITGSVNAPIRSDDPGEYCVNISDKAVDARVAWQALKIKELEKEIDKRISELENKRAEYQVWAKERERILAKAETHLVDIYAKMRSDAAAQQLAALEDDMAAAVLAKLNARAASSILNEMEPGRAAQLTKAMAAASKGMKNDKKGESKS